MMSSAAAGPMGPSPGVVALSNSPSNLRCATVLAQGFPSSSNCFTFSAGLMPRSNPRERISGAGKMHRRIDAVPSLMGIECRHIAQWNLPNTMQQGDVVRKDHPPPFRSIGGGGRQPPQGDGSSRGKNYISPPGLGQFRPPPSSYVPNSEFEETEEEKQNTAMKKKILVEKLRDGLGSWQEKAGFVKQLQELGVTSEDLYSLTFVPLQTQLKIVVAAQVYDSLVQSGTSPDVLQRFDEFNVDLLYALRTISSGQRRSAAEYVIEKAMSVEEAQKLAWAIKDHERRPLGRKGFTPAPGDCLAFMYHRQAIETQDPEQRSNIVEQGLKVAVTESAKQRFSEFS